MNNVFTRGLLSTLSEGNEGGEGGGGGERAMEGEGLGRLKI